MKTKEDILGKCIEDNHLIDEFASGFAEEHILNAMQDYANQFKKPDLVLIEHVYIEDSYLDGNPVDGRIENLWITNKDADKIRKGQLL